MYVVRYLREGGAAGWCIIGEVQQGVDIARFEDYCCMLLILILIHYLLTRKLRKLYKLLYLMHARS